MFPEIIKLNGLESRFRFTESVSGLRKKINKHICFYVLTVSDILDIVFFNYSAMLRKEMVYIFDTQSTEGYCDGILIKY